MLEKQFIVKGLITHLKLLFCLHSLSISNYGVLLIALQSHSDDIITAVFPKHSKTLKLL